MHVALGMPKRLFTAGEYEAMGQAGVLDRDERLELIDGEIYQMTPIGPGHAGCVDALTFLFTARVAGRAIVRVQNPIRLGDLSEPQPDLALLRPSADFYASGHPGPEDILLLVEVTETSATFDRAVKVPLYARSGVPEVWIVDLAARCVDLQREPAPNGYLQGRRVESAGTVTPLCFPDLALAVRDIILT